MIPSELVQGEARRVPRDDPPLSPVAGFKPASWRSSGKKQLSDFAVAATPRDAQSKSLDCPFLAKLH